MTFTKPTDDILIAGGTGPFSLYASGQVYGGQCVIPNDTMKVFPATDDTDAFVGVAVYDKEDGYIAVAGKGNIVRCIVNGTSKCTVGDDIFCSGSEGKISNTGTAANKIGVALETQATDAGTARILLV